MYHEIEYPGHPLCNTDAGYLRYVLKQGDFKDQLSFLADNGFNGINVGQSLNSPIDDPKKIIITFDDGCESDLTIAAPLITAFNFNATFFIVADFINHNGYLSKSQLCELRDFGVEIGCHSMTHQYLTDLDDCCLNFEIGVAKDRLEQILGIPVNHFSCPGGRWNKKVADKAASFGFQSVSTSQFGINSNKSDPFSLNRISILRNTSLDQFTKTCHRTGLFKQLLLERTLHSTKTLLGNSLYENIREKILSLS